MDREDDSISIPLFSTRIGDFTIFGQPVGWLSIIAELWEGEMIFFIGEEKTGKYWMIGYQDKVGYLKREAVIFFDLGDVLKEQKEIGE